jgi:hypothetical protein
MYGKDGLNRELEVIDTAWGDNGEFVLHHDLTSALRVGDLSIFQKDGIGCGWKRPQTAAHSRQEAGR